MYACRYLYIRQFLIDYVTHAPPTKFDPVILSTTCILNTTCNFDHNFNKCTEVLNNVFGYSQYRDGQKEIIENIFYNNNTLAIMPTGAGKSLCYQIPAIMSDSKTVIISPLIALIDDQVSSLRQLGINVSKMHSNQSNRENKISWDNFKN